jgi:DNA polymerase-4
MKNLLGFNPEPPKIMHIDLNSCFASIEQQANPLLRGKPVAVAAYVTPNGCILAASIEAKKYGVKTGIRVKDGKKLCPGLIVLSPDPWKYRNVHLRLKNLLHSYTTKAYPMSIDEFVLDLEGYPVLKEGNIHKVAIEIKARIREEIGEWLRVSVGIAPNRFLAKLASNLQKPDGLVEISKNNFLEIYSRLDLVDLPYIKLRNAARLNMVGIYSVIDFYKAPVWKLRAAFESINGYYWHLRLHGYEIDDIVFARRSFGNSYALPRPLCLPSELSPILAKLVAKTGMRLRSAGYKARGVHLAISFRDGSFWHKGVSFDYEFFDSREIFRRSFDLLLDCPVRKAVREIAVSVFNLVRLDSLQLSLFENSEKRKKIIEAMDRINLRWGNFVVGPVRMFSAKDAVADRIAFGGVKELEEFTTA